MKSSTFVNFIILGVLIGYIYFDQSRTVYPNQISNGGSPEPMVTQESGQPFIAVSYDLPTKISFANEETPLTIPDVRERLDKELQINIYLQSSTLFLIKRAHRWLPKIQEVLKANGIPDDFKYLPLIESSLMNSTSPKNAVGYWQILEDSGKELGLEITKEVDQRYDPIKATEAACKYLKKSYERFGSWTLAAASYNCGVSGLNRVLTEQKVSSYYDLHLNDETSRYVFRLLAIKEIFENPQKYGFRLKDEHLYAPENHKLVEVTESIPDLVAFAQEQGVNYKLLKRHNPWLRQNKLTVKKGKSYFIAIP